MNDTIEKMKKERFEKSSFCYDLARFLRAANEEHAAKIIEKLGDEFQKEYARLSTQ